MTALDTQQLPGRLVVTTAGGVAEIRIDNPSQRNALTRAICRELVATVAALDARDDVEVILLRGAGGTFSAGVAISELRDVLFDERGSGEEQLASVDHLSLADAAFVACATPTVAVVEGYCVGGGWQLASACDWIVASSNSTFGITPSKLGIVYPRPGLERLVRLVGPANARYILATGRLFDARRALSYGLVAEVFEADAFEHDVAELATQLRERSRFSIRATKALIAATERGSEAAELDAIWQATWEETASGPDLEIGLSAFLHRERPRFVSR